MSLLGAIHCAFHSLRGDMGRLGLNESAYELELTERAAARTAAWEDLPFERKTIGQRNALWGPRFGYVFVDLLDYKALLPAALASLAEGDEGQQQAACDLIVPFVPQPPGSKRSGTWLLWREERMQPSREVPGAFFDAAGARGEVSTVLRRDSRPGHWWLEEERERFVAEWRRVQDAEGT